MKISIVQYRKIKYKYWILLQYEYTLSICMSQDKIIYKSVDFAQ